MFKMVDDIFGKANCSELYLVHILYCTVLS